MSADTSARLHAVLEAFPVAALGGMALGTVAQFTVDDTATPVTVRATLGLPCGGFAATLADELAGAVHAATGIGCAVTVDSRIVAHAVQGTLSPLPGVANIVAVASGKGGVGKSTTAVNLALALAADGARVGLLDADLYGPSQPRMLGLMGRELTSPDNKHFEPLEAWGIRTNSIGFLVPEDKPLIWRGPMVTKVLVQLVFDTLWGPLDYLIVDLPPGTGDTQLTLTQKVPLAGVVIVTTPQEIALQDARKGLNMFNEVGVAVLGVVENMASFVCPCCGNESPVFGEGGGERLATDSDVLLLGRLPLDSRIREEADGGRPTVVAAPDGAQGQRYMAFARRTAAALARRPRDQRGKFGAIVVERGP